MLEWRGNAEDFFRPKAFCIKENCAEFQCGIVGNPKPPVGRNIPSGVLQITIDDTEKIRNFLPVGLM